jgi:DNA segregation ATPase FtsK/SpoIIIE-like protein
MNDVEWVRQYVAFAEPQLERIIVGAKLHAALTNVIRGPMTLTFQIRLQPHCLSKQNLDRVLGLGDVIASALDAEAVRMQRDSGTINIEVPLPPSVCVTPPGVQLARHTKDATVCIGIDSYKQPVFLDLRQHGAILWVGPTRSGKTQSMKSKNLKASHYSLVMK